MPNWCETTYKCVGDLKEVKSLHRILKNISNRKTSVAPNSFGALWLGNLVEKLGGAGKIIDAGEKFSIIILMGMCLPYINQPLGVNRKG